MFELYFNIQSSSGRFHEGSALRQWSQEYMRSLSLSGSARGRKDPRVYHRMPELIRDADLHLESHYKLDLHLSTWSTGGCRKS